MGLGFSFGLCPYVLEFLYNGNLFGRATLKSDFIVLIWKIFIIIYLLLLSYFFESDFEFVKWRAQLGCVC